MVPKGPITNLLFRRELIRKVMANPDLAGLLRQACAEDPFFYINCISAGTRVVTDRGPVPIEEVTIRDRVWDGREFVIHSGSLCKGQQSVIFKYKTWLTPEHKVWTNHGWEPAVEGHDRADVRLPDGYSSKWNIPEDVTGGLDVCVPLWEGDYGLRQQSPERELEELRLSDCGGGEREENDARSLEDPDICGMVCHAPAVRESQQRCVRQVRGPRDFGMCSVEEVRQFFGGHGRSSGRGADDRADRQQRQLRSLKLPVGIAAGTGKQHKTEPSDPDFAGRLEYIAGSGDCRSELRRSSEAVAAGSKGGQTLGPEVFAAVYDILNCGPRQSFTVLDADGRALLVHNCFVWTINQKRPHKRKKIPFVTYDYQDAAIDTLVDSVSDSFDVQIEKSRQMGASWLAAAMIQWYWRFHRGFNALLLSRSDEYVDKSDEPKSLFWKIDFIHRNVPTWLMPVGWEGRKHRKVKRIVNPENRATIVGEATTKDSGRGGTFTIVFLDEFGACDVGVEILKSTQAATGSRWFNSTPKGTGNAHYRVVQLSRQNPRQVRPLRFYWSQHPEFSKGLYRLDKNGVARMADPKRNPLPANYFEDNADLIGSLKKRGFWEEFKTRSPWFDIQCARATTKAEIAQELEIDYLGSGYQFFDHQDVQSLMQMYCCPAKYVGDLDFDQETLEPYEFRQHGHGRLEVWCELDRNAPPMGRPYVIGVDSSAGTGASNSVASVWDAKTGEKVAEFVDPTCKPERLAKQVIALCKWFDGAYLIWETNGSGRAFGDAVIEWGYGYYYSRAKNTETGETGAKAGWAPTRDNKYQLLSQYRGALTDRLAFNRSELALRETLEYVFLGNNWVEHASLGEVEDPSGARDQHGDRVIADALAVKVFSDQPKTSTQVTRRLSGLSVAGRRAQSRRSEQEQRSAYVF